MLEVIGFLFLCALNIMFSIFTILNFMYGGGDLGPLISGWVNWKVKLWGIVLSWVNLYFWYLLYTASPIGIILL